MANRFPLIVDSSGTAAIKELASGDNLDLTGNGIVGAGTVALTNLTVGGLQGSDGQVLTSTGSGIAWEDASGGSSTFGVATMTGDGSDTTLTLTSDPASENNTQVFIDGVYQPKSSYSVSGTTLTFSTAPPNGTSVEAIVGASSPAGVPSDASVTSAKLSGALTTPSTLTLGGNLDVSGHDIVTVSNAAIELDPNGSGVVTFKGNATRGAGQFKLNCENNSHGITIKGPPHSAAASYTLTLPNTDGSADQVLKTDGSGNLDWVDSGGGGGAWSVISSTTLSSAATSVELTLSGYDSYEIRFDKMEPHTRTQGGTAEYLRVYFSTNGGTSYSTNVKHNMRYSETRSNASLNYWYGSSYSGQNTTNYIDLIDLYKDVTFEHSLSGFVSVENNATGTPQKHGEFKVINGRDYSNVIQYFVRTGYFGIEESSVINKVKFDISGGASVPSGTRFTVYGLSTS